MLVSSAMEEGPMTKSIQLQKTKLPKMINTYIEWKDIRLKDKVIYYSYFIDDSKLHLPLKAAIFELRNSSKSNIIKTLKKSAGMKAILKRDYTLNYSYIDKEGMILHNFTIKNSDLQDVEQDTKHNETKSIK